MKSLWNKINHFINSIMFRVIGSIIILILIVTFVIEILSFTIFSRSIIGMYKKDGEQVAKEILTKINTNNFDNYLKEEKEEEYYNDYMKLILLGQMKEVSRIYIIQVDDKFEECTYIFDAVNIDTAVYDVGEKAKINSKRYKRKLKNLYSMKRPKENYMKRSSKNAESSYFTTLVPVKKADGEIVGILGIQYSIKKLVVSGVSFSIWASIITILIIIVISILVYRFFRKNIVLPIIDICDESKRFASENTIVKEKMLEEKLIEENSKITEIRELAQSIDKMECDTIKYIDNLTIATKERERVGTELKLASAIQKSMLANDLPNSSSFNISATMMPAKEVGGDFYDFYMIDDNHLALVIADVAGKGIPAALFMMITKVLLKTRMSISLTPAEVLTVVNKEIYKNNQTNMFITVWLGVLELSTGMLTFSNAGHEDIAIYREKKKFTIHKKKHGIVLGAFEDYEYKNYHLRLNGGDKLFLYTDGVVEAMNKDGTMFGVERMLEALNNVRDDKVSEILNNVQSDVDKFVGEATQFDDLTMLAVEYIGVNKKMKKTFKAKKEELDTVLSFVNKASAEYLNPKFMPKIDLVVEEIFINIVKYAYSDEVGDVDIEVKATDNKVVISFEDTGVAFNPLEIEEADVTLPIEEREIGGLGIYMVRKIMDNVEYMHKENKNVLVIEKNIDVEG